MLKKVVLPAPFGPMIETIDRVGMSNVDVVDREQTAESLGHGERPRGRARSPSAPACSCPHLVKAASPRRGAPAPIPLSSSLRLRSGSRPSGRSTIMITSRKPKIPKLNSVRSKSRPKMSCAPRGENVRDQVRVDERERDRPQDHSPDVPQAAEDDHREHEDRERELELVGVDRVQVRGEEGAGHPAEGGAGRVGEELRPHERDAHARRRDLVLAKRDPGPAEARVAQPEVHEQHQRHQRKRRSRTRV